jgi:WD40 repeat protein
MTSSFSLRRKVGNIKPVNPAELPYLLITGSWDCSIRIWDLRDGACIDTILDHGADVYGMF